MAKVDIEKLHADRRNAINEMQTLLDEVDARADKTFSGEEQAKYDKLNEAYDFRSKQIDAALRDQEAQRSLELAMAGRVEPVETEAPESEGVASQFRRMIKGEIRGFDIKPSKALGPDSYKEARDLSKLSAGAGANTVPTSFYDRLVEHMIEVSGILMAGPTVLTTTTGEAFQVPKSTAFGTSVLTAEAAAIAESDPTFGQVTLNAYKYPKLLQISNELLTDTGVDIEGFIAREAGRAVGNAFGAHAITGTGTSQPAGIVTGSTLGVTGAASVSGAFSADNLIDLYFSVIAPYRNSPSCAWMMRDATLGAVRKLKDTTNQYLWQPSLQVGAPDTLLGKPVYTDPNIAAVALSAKSVIFGDISQYFVRQVGAIRFESSTDYAFNQDMVTYRCVLRADGALVDLTGSVKHFIGNAA